VSNYVKSKWLKPGMLTSIKANVMARWIIHSSTLHRTQLISKQPSLSNQFKMEFVRVFLALAAVFGFCLAAKETLPDREGTHILFKYLGKRESSWSAHCQKWEYHYSNTGKAESDNNMWISSWLVAHAKINAASGNINYELLSRVEL